MTIYRMAKQNRIPCFKVGDEWRFRVDVINNWIAEKEKTTNATNMKVANEAWEL